MQQGTPAGGELGDADDVDRTQEGLGVVDSLQCRGHQIARAHHRRGQRLHNRGFQGGDRAKARMVVGPCLEVDAGAPGLAQGVDRSAHHAGEALDRVEFAQRRLRERGLDCRAQRLVVHRLSQTARQAGRELLEGHDLQTVPAFSSGVEAKLAHGETAMDDDGAAVCDYHIPLQARRLPLLSFGNLNMCPVLLTLFAAHLPWCVRTRHDGEVTARRRGPVTV